METSLFRYIIKHSLRQQLTLTALALISFVPLYYSYDVPKTIVNQGIQAKKVSFPHEVAFLGLTFDQVAYLMAMCGLFLLLVIVNQGFKYVIHVIAGLNAERMLRRLRFELYSRVLRFPLPVFKKMSAGEIIPMVTSEVEPLGGFIGESFSMPAQQGGTLLTILGFLLIQNPMMAAAAVSLYPLQLWLIPKLQSRVNQLGKERVKNVRKLSEKIGETISGVQEIHGNDASNRELADFSGRMGVIFRIRYRIYILKFLVKFLNNFIQQLGPFLFYSFGGYLVIQGELDIGTLMAAITAHKDLAAPWKELLNYYQLKEDARIKYEQVISQFDPPGMRDESFQRVEPETLPPLVGDIQAQSLTIVDDQNAPVVENVAFTAPIAAHTAIVGGARCGKDELLLAVAGLVAPTRGKIVIGGHDVALASEALYGRRVAYVGATGYVFNSTIGDNLYYGLRHRPPAEPNYPESERAKQAALAKESLAAGNTPDDHALDWTDYRAAGVANRDGLTEKAIEVLRVVDLDREVYQLGLRGRIDPRKNPDLADGMLKARAALREKLKDPSFASLVEIYDVAKFNANATLAENLMFGTPVDERFDMERFAEHPYIRQVLAKVGLDAVMLGVGHQVAETMVELFADLPPDHEFFQQFAFISSDDLPEYKALLARANKDNLGALPEADRTRLLSLPFKTVPARHRLGVLTPELEAKILEARRVFAADLPADMQGAIDFFDATLYNPAHNLMDNILLGRIAYGVAQAADRVGDLVGELIEQLGLFKKVVEVGLAFEVGIAGGRLTASQRQRLVIARAIIKNPDIVILNEATAILDSRTQAVLLERLGDALEPKGLVWGLHRASHARFFDHVIVMQDGKVVDHGEPAKIENESKTFKDLVAAE